MGKSKILPTSRINIKNKRAEHDYLVIDKYTAGVVLTGTEIKSIRAGKASLVDTFCYINRGEMWMKNAYIAEYDFGSYNNHSTRRDRKLLLNRKEIRSLQDDTKSPGFTIVPLRMFINEKGLAKVVIGLCRGKKEYDKRNTLKEKQDRREMDRAMKVRLRLGFSYIVAFLLLCSFLYKVRQRRSSLLYMQTIVVCTTQVVRYLCAKACQCGMRHYWQVKVKDKELV